MANPGVLLENFIEAIVNYKCAQHPVVVSYWQVIQAILDKTYDTGLIDWQAKLSGSAFEGVHGDVCSDQDIMVTARNWPKIQFSRLLKDSTSSLLTVSNTLHPSYLSLHVPSELLGNLQDSELLEDNLVASWISSNLLIESSLFVSSLKQANEKIQGPANTEFIEVVGDSGSINVTVDKVFYLQTTTWPPCAEEFKERNRKYFWPPNEIVSSAGDVFTVGIGHSESRLKHVQWRLSFSMLEKKLMHNLDSRMVGAYYILKAIRIRFLGDIKREDEKSIISSYHIKVCFLWVCENVDVSALSLVDLCRQVLNFLMECYRRKNLPHYIVRGENLLGHIEEGSCNRITNELQKVNQEIHKSILSSIELDSELEGIFSELKEVAESEKHMTPDSIQSGSKEEDLAPFSDICSYTMVPNCLQQVLINSVEKLSPDNSLFLEEKRYWFAHWSNITSDSPLFALLQEKINSGLPPQELIKIPDTVLRPFLDEKVMSIVLTKTDFIKMFLAAVNMHIGDLYQCLYFYLSYCSEQNYTNKGVHHNEVGICEKKCLFHYEMGTALGFNMVFPDKCTDYGLGYKVRILSFHYLKHDFTLARREWANMLPVLQWAAKENSINFIGAIEIIVTSDVCSSPWKNDKELYEHLMRNSFADDIAFFHPVCLAYYIKARLIQETERSCNYKFQTAQFAIACIRSAKEDIWSTEMEHTSSMLIDVLQEGLIDSRRIDLNISLQ